MMKYLAIFTMLLTTSCATILSEDTKKVNITSNRAPVRGTINGVPFSAPGVAAIKREKKDQVVKITTPGCRQTLVLEKKVDNVFFVNILSGGTFGSSTDYGTGKMWKYEDQLIINSSR